MVDTSLPDVLRVSLEKLFVTICETGCSHETTTNIVAHFTKHVFEEKGYLHVPIVDFAADMLENQLANILGNASSPEDVWKRVIKVMVGAAKRIMYIDKTFWYV